MLWDVPATRMLLATWYVRAVSSKPSPRDTHFTDPAPGPGEASKTGKAGTQTDGQGPPSVVNTEVEMSMVTGTC